MSKLKTNRGAAKRFKKTGGGGFKRRAANRNHILSKVRTKVKRHLRGMRLVNDADKAAIKKLLPFS